MASILIGDYYSSRINETDETQEFFFDNLNEWSKSITALINGGFSTVWLDQKIVNEYDETDEDVLIRKDTIARLESDAELIDLIYRETFV